jgi:hypothetical protein
MAKGKAQERGPIVSMEVVERPLGVKNTWPVMEEVKAIVQTVETGKAVKLAFRTGEELKKIQMALRHAVSKEGLTMRYRKDAGDRIIAWAEKVKETQ